MIARGGFGFGALDLDYGDAERDRRIDARDRARSRCEDLTPRCACCRGRGGFEDEDPDGRRTGAWAECEPCEGSGIANEPPPIRVVHAPTLTTTTITDFGDDEIPF